MIALLVSYLVGTVLWWPRFVRSMAWLDTPCSQRTLTVHDKWFGIIFGTLMTLIWPIAVVFSVVNKAITKDSSFWGRPKPLQSPVASIKQRRSAKAEAARKQKKMEDAERRIAINRAERENEMTLTTWED